MCGIAGQRFRQQQPAEQLRTAAAAMAHALRHRGPDMSGAWVHPAGLGSFSFARLAIQDLSPEANQPMVSDSGRYRMMLNGEIYNCDELRSRLNRPATQFRTTSDTEVLLAFIETFGLEAALRAANGMFAVALWDGRTDELFLARDRLGKKPLHYTVDHDAVRFASEVKALVPARNGSWTLSPTALRAFFQLTYIPAPLGIFEEVRKVRPGHIVSVRRDLSIEERAYWSLADVVSAGAESPVIRFEGAVEQTTELLADAVRRRLVGDVPVGVLLSGGLDSSLVAAYTRKATDAVQAFTVGVEDAALDEAPAAEKLARHIGIRHSILRLSHAEALQAVDAGFETMDEPFGDSSAIPTYAICRLARQHVTVLLTGDGGDEVFGGYTRYLWASGWRRLAAALYAQWRTGGRAWSRPDVAKEIYRRLLSLGDDGGSVSAEFLRQLCAAPPSSLPSTLAHLRWLDFQLYLPDDILVKLDRFSMATSVELRSPFLDYRLVELSWRVAGNALVHGGLRKRIPRELFLRAYPRKLLQQEKHGFALPFADWLAGPLRPQMEAAVEFLGEHPELPISAEKVRASWKALRAGERRRMWDLWLVFTFWRWSQAWQERVRKAAQLQAAGAVIPN